MFASAGLNRVLCLGWDVGGWSGRKDGLASCLLDLDAGTLEPVGHAISCGLGEVIADNGLTLPHMMSRIGVEPLFDAVERVVLAVDAPLGFPREFVRSASAHIGSIPPIEGGPPKRFINNRLAFRETDRLVFEVMRKRPLSPSLDSLANNVTKARVACSQLRQSAISTRIVPFEQDDAEVAVIEVYPALWKPVEDVKARYPRLSGFFDFVGSTSNPHQQDAYLCALSGASYEATIRDAFVDILPRVLLPAGSRKSLKIEGWIYAPLTRNFAGHTTKTGQMSRRS